MTRFGLFEAMGADLEWRGRISSLIAVPLLIGSSLAYLASAETVEVRIEDKAAGFDLPSDSGGSPQVLFLVYTDRGVFNIGYEPLFLDFKAAERYHALKVGQRYRVIIAGWRIPITNWYPRIVRIADDG